MVVLGLIVLGMVHSRSGPFWEWSVLGMVAFGMVVLGMVVLGLVEVPLAHIHSQHPVYIEGIDQTSVRSKGTVVVFGLTKL
jgi:ABC-type tungstate transport system substrate-binding protein